MTSALHEKAKLQPRKGSMSARKSAVAAETRKENSRTLQSSFAEMNLSPSDDAA